MTSHTTCVAFGHNVNVNQSNSDGNHPWHIIRWSARHGRSRLQRWTEGYVSAIVVSRLLGCPRYFHRCRCLPLTHTAAPTQLHPNLADHRGSLADSPRGGHNGPRQIVMVDHHCTRCIRSARCRHMWSLAVACEVLETPATQTTLG